MRHIVQPLEGLHKRGKKKPNQARNPRHGNRNRRPRSSRQPLQFPRRLHPDADLCGRSQSLTMRRKMIYRLLQHSSSSTSHGAPGTTSGMMTCKPACANHAVGISGGHCRFSTVTGYRHTRPLIPAAALNLFHCSRVCNTPMQRSLISSRNFLRSACTASEIHITAAATYTEQQTDVRSSTVATTLSETSSAAGLPAAAVPVPGTLAALLANPPPGNVLDTWRLFLRTIHQLGHFPSTATDM